MAAKNCLVSTDNTNLIELRYSDMETLFTGETPGSSRNSRFNYNHLFRQNWNFVSFCSHCQEYVFFLGGGGRNKPNKLYLIRGNFCLMWSDSAGTKYFFRALTFIIYRFFPSSSNQKNLDKKFRLLPIYRFICKHKRLLFISWIPHHISSCCLTSIVWKMSVNR